MYISVSGVKPYVAEHVPVLGPFFTSPFLLSLSALKSELLCQQLEDAWCAQSNPRLFNFVSIAALASPF